VPAPDRRFKNSGLFTRKNDIISFFRCNFCPIPKLFRVYKNSLSEHPKLNLQTIREYEAKIRDYRFGVYTCALRRARGERTGRSNAIRC
jgi:hypothetical protein